ncbi:PTS ascorbate-specific transporter subunit IIA [Psittacicella hinzii]|uniref:Ascorbate-specific PTS system EIIA component n=1 Tax=Psittacicella hinzii TaxID=2028575 RepID=A0A3A1Y7I9_9GAMM|nr:PTS sugar transporter subunit IIA [Psittacicella hinzii]RIY33230.1 PTS ascorbate-specific transporter subunit IIA [Psittacicella hinzii]
MSVNLKDSLLQNNSIRLKQKVATWQEAVKLGTDILEANGTITPDYYQAILKCEAEHGPYFHLCPGLAMPHARPEDGVKVNSFALVTLEEPVALSDGSLVDVFITLAGADNNSHMNALMQIMSTIEDEESDDGVDLERLRSCSSVEDVIKVIDTYVVTTEE